MLNKKLLVNEWFKTYEVLIVNEECFKQSPNIETVGTMKAFKILNNKDLEFKISYLNSLGFKENFD